MELPPFDTDKIKVRSSPPPKPGWLELIKDKLARLKREGR